MKERTAKRKKIVLPDVPAEVLAGSELGKKEHAAQAAKLSVRSIENYGKAKRIPVVRLSPRCVRYHIPSVLRALRKFEITPSTIR
jgi:hypothetical protein